MSLATDARGYADQAVAQGKTALAQASAAITQASSTVTSVNRRLLADAPKPAYAALGVADLLAATVTKRVEDLPVDAVNGVSKAQRQSQALLTRAQTEALAKLNDLIARFDESLEAVSALPNTAKTTGEEYLKAARAAGDAYLNVAKQVYASLSERGADKAAELREDPRLAKLRNDPRLAKLRNDPRLAKLRNDPRVANLFARLGDAGEDLQAAVSPIAKSAFDAVASSEPAQAATTSARKSTSRTSTARKTPARKAPAKSASAAKKAPAKASPRKSAKS